MCSELPGIINRYQPLRSQEGFEQFFDKERIAFRAGVRSTWRSMKRRQTVVRQVTRERSIQRGELLLLEGEPGE